MDLGLELRDARNRAGLSREEVSSRLNVQLRYIEALEDNDALLRGPEHYALVRAYAPVVGLDPDDLIARAAAGGPGTAEIWLPGHVVIDEFPREADLPSSTTSVAPPVDPRPVSPAPPLPQDAQPRASTAVERPVVAVSRPDAAHVAAIRPSARVFEEPPDLPLRPVAAEPPDTAAPVSARRDPFEPAAEDMAGRRGEREIVLATSVGGQRGVGVVVAALMVIVLAIFGGAFVYEKTRRAPDDVAAAGGQAASRPAAADPTDRPGDDPTGRPDVATSGDVPQAPPAPPPASSAPSAVATAPPAEPSAAATPLRTEPGAAPEPALPDEPPRETPLAAPSEDLSGLWRFVTHVESTSVSSFEGMELAYRIRLGQNGNIVDGTGRKVSENGRMLAAAAQTPIVLNGTIEGERLTITFTEEGSRRRSSGRFVLVREDDAAWRGRFSSDAARSSGTVLASRAE